MTAAPVGSGSPLPGGLREVVERLYAWEIGEAPIAGHAAGISEDADPPAPGPAAGASAGDGPLSAMAEALRDGSQTPATLLEQALDGIARTDPDIRAWVTIDEAGARRQAATLGEERAAGRVRGPLHGIPVGVKDLIDVAGVRTGAGSRHLSAEGRERVPAADAGSVRLLRQAGAVIVGKTTTHEFAFGGTTPPTRNPADLSRIPGGSSGGSAAAVAAGQIALALGSDTGGSVRIPSAYCGTVGLVPSPGLLPADGVVPLAWSLDRVGLITVTAADLALAAAALGITGPAGTGLGNTATGNTATGNTAAGNTAAGNRAAGVAGALAPGQPGRLTGLRVGVPAWAFDEPIDRDVAAAVRRSLDLAAASGAMLREVAIPHGGAAVDAGMTIMVAESADYHRQRLAERPDLFGEDVLEVLALADDLLATGYVRAQRLRHVLRAEMLAVLAEVDVLALPTMPCTAPEWAAVAGGMVPVGGTQISMADAHLRYTVCCNLAGLPCGTQPCGLDGRGLPIGLQWAAAPGRDDLVLRAMTGFAAAQAAAGRHDGSGGSAGRAGHGGTAARHE